MIEREIEIINRLGLHARAAAKLVQTCGRYQSRVQLSFRNREVNAQSILGVMMLAAGKGSILLLRVEGEDEAAALEAVVALFERRFDEPD